MSTGCAGCLNRITPEAQTILPSAIARNITLAPSFLQLSSMPHFAANREALPSSFTMMTLFAWVPTPFVKAVPAIDIGVSVTLLLCCALPQPWRTAVRSRAESDTDSAPQTDSTPASRQANRTLFMFGSFA